VHEMFKKQLAGFVSRWNELIDKDVRAFNEMLREKGIRNIISKSRSEVD